MRRRMQELAAGVYESVGPQIRLSEERMEIHVPEEKALKGSFSIESVNQVPMRGIVYSNNPRMVLGDPEFSGTNAVVEYQFHTDGLAEGDIQKGEFSIICNKNEYTLSFVVFIEREYQCIDEIRLTDLASFADLARKDYRRAYRYFTSGDFALCLQKEDSRIRLLARVLAYEGAPIQNLEEFLVSAGLKKTLTFTCSFEDQVYENLTQDVREVIEVNKDGWGFAKVEVYADAFFLHIPKHSFEPEDFIGQACRIPFFVLPENLHAGNNFGRIRVECGNQIFQYQISVKNEREENREHREWMLDRRHTVYRLTRLYLDYRSGKVMPASWGSETLKLLEHILAKEDENILFWLAKAQVLLLCGRNQEAQWVLDKCKKIPFAKDSREQAYYLYITTFITQEKSYVRKVAASIEEAYRKSEEDFFLFWMLLFISETFENSRKRKYRAIKEYTLYHPSPVLYVECYQLLKEQPDLLENLDPFEVRLLYWIYKENLLTKELARRLMAVLRYNKQYYELLTPILGWCQQQWPQEEFLSALCSHLIQGCRYGKDVLAWYELAIEKQLMINGLYEAYIISAAKAGETQYPKMVQYYFQYQTNLPYKYRAMVYAGIIRNRDKQTSLYLNCKPEMEQLALEQIAAGHMDENLAQIYDMYLKPLSMTHELSRSLAPLLFIHKLSTDRIRSGRVVVVHRQLNRVMSYPLVEGVAYFPVYGKEKLVALEDEQGCRYVAGAEFDLIRLLNPESYVRKCLKVAPEQMPYLIHTFDYDRIGGAQLKQLSDSELGYLNILLSSESISEDYKQILYPELIRFYHESGRVELLDEYLRSLDFRRLGQSVRLLACELLIERGFFEQAYEAVVAYGCYMISASHLLTLCTCMIDQMEFKENRYLACVCTMLFARGKYNEQVLTYLSRFMYGSTGMLYELWIAARDFKVPCFELEERLLVQMLYTESYINKSEEILSSYIGSGGKKLVLDAYVSYFSYQYFVREAPANHLAMEHIYTMAKRKERLGVCLKLALLKWMGETGSTQYELMQELYDQLMLKGYVFAFYNILPKEVTKHFPRLGKQVVEYRSTPGRSVFIRYLHTDYKQGRYEEDEYVTQQMSEMLEGIYVKEFTLFYGDTVQYYISELQEHTQKILTSGQICNMDLTRQKDESRYTRLNSLIIAEQLGEEEAFETGRQEYDHSLEVVKKGLSWIR
ncbi:MAG: DUF5717 family protein [Lachnospiraceae bacterium]